MMALQGADQRSDGLLERFRADPASLSAAERNELSAYLMVYGAEIAKEQGEAVAKARIENLLETGPSPERGYPFAGGTTQEKIAYADALRAKDGVTPWNLFWTREQSSSEMLYHDAEGYLHINSQMKAMADVGAPALYFLTGELGAAIRIAGLADSAGQMGYGAAQVQGGDTGNGIANIVFGAMGAASIKFASAKPAVGAAATESKALAQLPEWYRDVAGVGADVVKKDGYLAVHNTRTGNIEYLAADGTLYLRSGDQLLPKDGGNLAVLAAAEREILASKGAGGSGGAKDTTRFIDGIKVVDQKTGQVLQGTVDLGPTLERIKSGGSFPHRNDGSIFQNRALDLPQKPAGYYTEYVHPTAGIAGPGPQRIVVGKGGEMYYTADHYKTFIPIKN